MLSQLNLSSPLDLMSQLGPGPNFPNTDSIQGGIQRPTGLSITVTSLTSFIMQFEVRGMGSRRLKDPSANYGDGDPAALNLQGYIPYGNATLATEEQMKELRGPRPTKSDLFLLYENQLPGIPFDFKNDYTNNMRGSAPTPSDANKQSNSTGQTTGSSGTFRLAAIVWTILAVASVMVIV